jgi:hypothetical protein
MGCTDGALELAGGAEEALKVLGALGALGAGAVGRMDMRARSIRNDQIVAVHGAGRITRWGWCR